jgi:hypothetical protein
VVRPIDLYQTQWSCSLSKAYTGRRAWEATGSRLLRPCYLRRENHDRKIRSRKQRTDIGKYAFVKRTIINRNQLSADLLASFPCKLNTFRKRVKKVVTNKWIRWGLNVNTCMYCVVFIWLLHDSLYFIIVVRILLFSVCIIVCLLYWVRIIVCFIVLCCLRFIVLCLLFIVLCTYYFMFVFYCIVFFTFYCIVLYYWIVLLYRFCLY